MSLVADDFNRLADKILTFARSAIAKDGVLLPIAAVVTIDGNVAPVVRVQPPTHDDTAPGIVNELIDILRRAARDGTLRAVAWCVDMRVTLPGATEKTDALVLFCEASGGEAGVSITPYRGAPGPGTTFAEPILQANRPQIFLAPTGR